MRALPVIAAVASMLTAYQAPCAASPNAAMTAECAGQQSELDAIWSKLDPLMKKSQRASKGRSILEIGDAGLTDAEKESFEQLSYDQSLKVGEMQEAGCRPRLGRTYID